MPTLRPIPRSSGPYTDEPTRGRSPYAQAIVRFRRNRMGTLGFALLVAIHLVAAFGPLVGPYLPNEASAALVLSPVSRAHLFGTDEVGRDVLTRLVYGARVSLVVSWAAVGLSVFIGTALGASTGFAGGWIDSVGMRITDAFLSVPMYFVLLIALSIFGSNLPIMVLVIAFTAWMPVARLVRSEVLSIKECTFVEAARAIGAPNLRIIVIHILPQAVPSIIVAVTLGVAHAILVESALSYLGLGIQPPQASLGNMLRNAQDYLWYAPRLAIYPGVLILIIVLSYNWFGDGLRDALDPRLSRD